MPTAWAVNLCDVSLGKRASDPLWGGEPGPRPRPLQPDPRVLAIEVRCVASAPGSPPPCSPGNDTLMPSACSLGETPRETGTGARCADSAEAEASPASLAQVPVVPPCAILHLPEEGTEGPLGGRRRRVRAELRRRSAAEGPFFFFF